MQLENKTALVTGGTEGLGLSIVKRLLKEQCVVHVISRDTKKQQLLAKELNTDKLHFHAADVSQFYEIETVVKQVGEIDILINNAGVWLEGLVENNTAESISKVIDVNSKGVIYTAKCVLPNMRQKNDGFIINVTSTSGLKGRDNQSVYVASKFAVTGFTESLKEDLKGTNIKVAGFYPGGMHTKLFSNAGYAKSNDDWMDTDKVAEVIIFMLKLDDSMILDHVVLNKRNTKVSH